jgi:ELWxxDGT repeat protein
MLSADVQMIDVNLNGSGSFPESMSEVKGTLLFTAFGLGDSRLRTTDGTEAGTVELNSDPAFPSARELTDVNGTVFFSGFDSDFQGGELWKTDGTVAGTVLVKEIAVDGYGPKNLTNVNGELFFTAPDDRPRPFSLGVSRRWHGDDRCGRFSGSRKSPPICRRPFRAFVGFIHRAQRDTASLLFRIGGTGNCDPRHEFRLGIESRLHVARRRPEKTIDRIPGDANGDGIFDSGDLVQVFQRAEYEDGIPTNSTFEDGGWNGDQEFDTGDLVAPAEGSS